MKINVTLVSQLVNSQFPDYAHLPIRPIAKSGHDNRTFHLGDDFSVRLPSAVGYATQVTKEKQWLPYLQQHLSLPITQQVAVGKPEFGYPYAWSICRWLPGNTAADGPITDLNQFAVDLADFLIELQSIDCQDGPPAGLHNYYRGGSLTTYSHEVGRVLANNNLNLQANRQLLATIWQTAIDSTWNSPAVWVHGDVAPTNMLVVDGQLSSVIDFGVLGTGDPSCDLVMAWTFFTHNSQQTFKDRFSYPVDVWQRAKGWALWKALITIEEWQSVDSSRYLEAIKVIHQIIADRN